MKKFRAPKTSRPLVVEGAGGVMVPLNKRALVIDLMVKLRLPVIVIARSGLGTINHTLLSLKALREKKCNILGVIMNGKRNQANVAAIENYGRARVLWQMTPIKPLNGKTLARAGSRLKKALGEPAR
jgi:dethiobiotin synthetase